MLHVARFNDSLVLTSYGFEKEFGLAIEFGKRPRDVAQMLHLALRAEWVYENKIFKLVVSRRLAWLGLAWLGLAWLGLAWLAAHLLGDFLVLLRNRREENLRFTAQLAKCPDNVAQMLGLATCENFLVLPRNRLEKGFGLAEQLGERPTDVAHRLHFDT